MGSARLIPCCVARGRLIPRFYRHLASLSSHGCRDLREYGVLADHDRRDFKRKDGVLRHLRGFLADSSSASSSRQMGSWAPTESSYLHQRNSFFATSAADISSAKPVEGSSTQNHKVVKKGSADEEITDVKIMRSLVQHLWLKDNLEFRMRVVLALGLLVGAKVINVQVPFLSKLAVDWLSAITSSSDAMASFNDANSTLLTLFVSPAAVLVGYGIARVGTSACNELRNAVFSKVALRAIRTVSKKVFSHLHDLDLGYHLSGEQNLGRL